MLKSFLPSLLGFNTQRFQTPFELAGPGLFGGLAQPDFGSGADGLNGGADRFALNRFVHNGFALPQIGGGSNDLDTERALEEEEAAVEDEVERDLDTETRLEREDAVRNRAHRRRAARQRDSFELNEDYY